MIRQTQLLRPSWGDQLSRRNFFRAAAAAGAALGMPSYRLFAAKPERQDFELCAFTKPLQTLGFEQLADVVAGMGFDSIEAPVRPGGHIEPEEAEEELPRLVEVLKTRDLKISILTSRINSLEDSQAKGTLRTAASLGIKFFRMAYYRYDLKQPILQQLENIKPKLEELVAFSKEVGITPLYQNHSGATRVGAPLWDIHRLISGYSSSDIGLAFDLGHATIEGSQSWPIQFDLVKPSIRALYVKDFQWRGTRSQWVPLGEGVTDREFYRRLRSWKFSGPISLHIEYCKDRSVSHDSKLLSAYRTDLQTLRNWLAA